MLQVNRALMARYNEAWQRGDLPATMAFMADQIVLNLPGRIGEALGQIRGREAVVGTVLTAFATLGEESGMVVDDLLFSDDGAVMIATETAWLDGERVTWGWAVHYGLAGGKIAEISVYVDDQHAIERFVAWRTRDAASG